MHHASDRKRLGAAQPGCLSTASSASPSPTTEFSNAGEVRPHSTKSKSHPQLLEIMEAWKFVDYTTLDTLTALSLTTARWGLEPFPSNLEINGVGATHIGPAHSDIVGVVHGISLIVSIIAMVSIFVILDRITNGRKAKPAAGLDDRHIKGGYNPPFQAIGRKTPTPIIHTTGHRDAKKTDAEKAKWITACSDLLRQKYNLQLQIWACREQHEKERLQRKSDAMHCEIWSTVNHWKSLDSSTWTDEELHQIDEIWNAISAP
jgi:hypothetical protein